MDRSIKLLVICAGLALSAPSFAASNGWYAGVGVGWSNASASSGDTSVGATTVDKNDIGAKLKGGYQFNQNFALEADYLYFGRVKYKSSTASAEGSVRTHALSLNIVGILPLADQFIADVKVGVYRSFVGIDSGMSFSTKPDDTWGASYGLGVEYEITPTVGFGVSWDQILRHHKNSLLAANLVYHFN